jgi:hypothetical protein
MDKRWNGHFQVDLYTANGTFEKFRAQDQVEHLTLHWDLDTISRRSSPQHYAEALDPPLCLTSTTSSTVQLETLKHDQLYVFDFQLSFGTRMLPGVLNVNAFNVPSAPTCWIVRCAHVNWRSCVRHGEGYATPGTPGVKTAEADAAKTAFRYPICP